MSDQHKKPSGASGSIWGEGIAPQMAPETWREGLYAREALPLIVFDLDGTLLDSHEMSLECNRRTIAALGLSAPSAELLELLNGPSPAEACALIGLPPERVEEVCAAMALVEAALVPIQARLFPGTLAMLEALEPMATLCLLTNGQPSYMMQVCEVTGIGPFFAQRSGFAPGITKAMRLREWMGKYAPRRVLMVGDRVTDIEAAREAGAASLAVTYGGGSTAGLHNAHGMAHDIAGVLHYCQRFCKE